MAQTFIYKPVTSKGPVFLAPGGKSNPPTIRLPSGKTITGSYYNTVDEGLGPRSQYTFPREILGLTDFELSYGDQVGKITSGGQSFEGANLASWEARSKGSAGGGGYPSGFGPGFAGQYGVYPNYLGGQFPSPFLAQYSPIGAAPYTFTDPQEFAKAFGGFNREEITKNFQLAKQFGLEQVATELAGLQGYTPAASALKRGETAIDNLFNQYQREQQVARGLPGVREELAGQTGRAESYARGRIPDEISDRALELGIRSEAADLATFGGFGARSAAGRKVSDLLSAEKRVQLSQYGDQLLTQNIGTRANLFLAPTEYSDAGAQIRVMPEVGAGRAAAQFAGEINQYASIPATTALGSVVGQNQFTTGLEQQTRQFNAGNQLQLSEFNAGTQNQFALTKFGYDVGYAGTVAGAAQTDINTQTGLQQQAMAMEVFKQYLAQAQQTDLFKSLAGLGGIGLQTGFIQNILGQLGIPGLGGAGKVPGAGGVPGAGAVTGINPFAVAGAAIVGENVSEGKIPSIASNIPGPIGAVIDPVGGAINSVVGHLFSATAPEGAASITSGETAPVSYAPVTYPGISSVPSNYTPIGSSQNGVIAVPNQAVEAEYNSFAEAVGLPVSTKSSRQVVSGGNGVVSAVGLSYVQAPGHENIGMDLGGAPVYSNIALSKINSPVIGAVSVSGMGSVLNSMGVLDQKDVASLSKVAALSFDSKVIADLDRAKLTNNPNTFVNSMLKAIGNSSVSETSDISAKESAFAAYKLYPNWQSLSQGQKSLALSSLGLKNFKYSDGQRIQDKIIPSTQGTGYQSLKVGEALNLMQKGVNAPVLTQKWVSLNDIHEIMEGGSSPIDVANTAVQIGALGSGPEGAAVPGIDDTRLKRNGWTASPAYGVGALIGKQSSILLPGYVRIGRTQSGNAVSIPSNTVHTANGVIQGNEIAGISDAAQAIHQNWGKTKETTLKGVNGGTALTSSLKNLGAAGAVVSNPFLAGALSTTSLMSSMGPSKLTSKEVSAKLKTHGLEVQDTKINHDEDLRFSMSASTVALTRLLTGEKGEAIHMAGHALAEKASQGLTGMTPSSFGEALKNVRSDYVKAGISSKSDAFALANQGFAEGRFDENDLASMHTAFNIVFDRNGYTLASQLLSGKERGLEVLKKKAAPVHEPMKDQGKVTQVRFKGKDELKAINRERYAASTPSQIAA